jgi:TatD DNase family protein
MYLSFAGNITYKKSDHMRDAARFVPRDRYVIETDSPYLPPEGHRGKPNEPANIIHTARYIAELRGISLEFLAEQTTRNAKTLLSL